MQAGEAIGVTEPCYWLCIFQGAAYPATSPAPGLTPPMDTPSQNSRASWKTGMPNSTQSQRCPSKWYFWKQFQ